MRPKKLINRRLTISDVIELRPCGWERNDDGRNYTPERIARLFAGRETLTLGDVLTMDEISISDRLWVVLKRGVLPESVRVGLGCDYAERVLAIAESWAGNEGLSRLAIDVTRKWLRGEAADKERSTAAAALSALSANTAADAANTAADAAALAAYAAADAAAYAAAAADADADAEREWQLKHTIKVLSATGGTEK